MKEVYIKPCMITESFMPNQAVSTCTVEGGISWTFDCMAGNQVDTHTVIAANGSISTDIGACDTKVGYAKSITTAYDFQGSRNHTNHNKSIATWGNGKVSGSGEYSGSYYSVTYKGAEGILYADADGKGSFSTAPWGMTTIDGVVGVAHSNKGGKMHHMVAPVVDSRTINASW